MDNAREKVSKTNSDENHATSVPVRSFNSSSQDSETDMVMATDADVELGTRINERCRTTHVYAGNMILSDSCSYLGESSVTGKLESFDDDSPEFPANNHDSGANNNNSLTCASDDESNQREYSLDDDDEIRERVVIAMLSKGLIGDTEIIAMQDCDQNFPEKNMASTMGGGTSIDKHPSIGRRKLRYSAGMIFLALIALGVAVGFVIAGDKGESKIPSTEIPGEMSSVAPYYYGSTSPSQSPTQHAEINLETNLTVAIGGGS